jgi:hypothetical protein
MNAAGLKNIENFAPHDFDDHFDSLWHTNPISLIPIGKAITDRRLLFPLKNTVTVAESSRLFIVLLRPFESA